MSNFLPLCPHPGKKGEALLGHVTGEARLWWLQTTGELSSSFSYPHPYSMLVGEGCISQATEQTISQVGGKFPLFPLALFPGTLDGNSAKWASKS